MKSKIIKPGIGLGDVKFGILKSDLAFLLGKADEVDNYSYNDSGNDNTENWHYDSLELSVGFDEEDDWRLITLSISNKSYELFNFHPIGLNRQKLTDLLNKQGVKDLEHEDMATIESPTHELVSSDTLGMNFWFDDGQISEVQWGPFFIDDETIDWPE